MNREILNRFFNGKATKVEIEQIVEYLYSDKIDEDLHKVIVNELENKETHISYDHKKNFIKIIEHINSDNHVHSGKLNGWVKLAAAIILLAVSTFTVFSVIGPAHLQQEQTEVKTIKSITKRTEKGQKLQMKLPDGSHVVLNSGSKINYTDNFGEQLREVFLSGEAYFEVVKDSLKPFVVNVNGIKVSVLGTSFNVNNRDDAPVTVALVKGKVLVEDQKGSRTIIQPGEMVKESNNGLIKSLFDYKKVIGWKDGWLTFDQDAFPDVINALELWYGVHIQFVGRPAEDYHYTGKFKNKSLEEVLHGISYVMDFNFKIDYDDVKINFNTKNNAYED